MLVRFTTANHLSFKEKTTLNLQASGANEYQTTNTFQTPLSDYKLLKSLAIYGPNSSGKTNMFKAMQFMIWFILNSSKDSQANEKISVDSFKLSTTTLDKPSYFEIELIIGDTNYRYGFEADVKNVKKEWLFYRKKNKEYSLFIREGQDISLGDKFDVNRQVMGITRENALFLSVAAQFNSHISTEIIGSLDSIRFVSGYRDESHLSETVELLENPKYGEIARNFILSADLGFINVVTEKFQLTEEMLSKSQIPKEVVKYFLSEKPDSVHFRTEHQVFDENDNPINTVYLNLMKNESLGTQKYISLAGPILNAIIKGGTLVIDEFSSRMHPLLSESIMKLFNSNQNNPNNSQFVFATHNTRFINKTSKIFRRDQMILFKKDQYGGTKVQSLYDLRVRKDASFEKEYFLGSFDAIPKIDISKQLSLFDQEPVGSN